MQIEPETANSWQNCRAGTASRGAISARRRINVAYGSYYLRYLLDHYEGNEMLAIAAYNAGLANVDKWVAKARAEGAADDRHDPLPGDARLCAARARSAEGIPRDVRQTARLELISAPDGALDV